MERPPRALDDRRPIVVIVDDHIDSLELYALGLSAFGFEACVASTVADAFELICERQPDVIVTDLALPVTDGFALIRRLKADLRTTGIPIVAVSGHAGASTRAEVLGLGAIAFLPKPCTVHALAETLRQILFPTS